MSEPSAAAHAPAIREWLQQDAACWIAIASAFLQRYEREIALDKLSAALQYQLRDGPPKPTTITSKVYRSGVSRIDYDALALELVVSVEKEGGAPFSKPGA